MNGHAARNPMLWYGRTPCYGVMINDHDAHHPYTVAWQRMVMWYTTKRRGVMINGHDAYYPYGVAWQ